MASIQAKKGINGKKVYYVVVSLKGKQKWIRGGTQQQAKILRRDIEALQESQKIEKLGLTHKNRRIDTFFREYIDYISVRTSPNTVKRYRTAINAFLAFLNMFYPRMQRLSQIKQEHIEEYQLRRLDSIELKVVADGPLCQYKRDMTILPCDDRPSCCSRIPVLKCALLWLPLGAQQHFDRFDICFARGPNPQPATIV